jgi:hypothetical protein
MCAIFGVEQIFKLEERCYPGPIKKLKWAQALKDNRMRHPFKFTKPLGLQ